MEVRKLFQIYVLCILTALHGAAATTSTVELRRDDDSGKCTTTYTVTQKLSSEHLAVEGGRRGDKGDRGPLGPKGEMGDVGIFGLPGVPGLPGRVGIIGRPGVRGLVGIPGNSGFTGSPGLPGLPGICHCAAIAEEHVPQEKQADVLFGDETYPANVTCMFAPPGVSSGVKYMGPKGHTFQVYCNMTTNETCVRSGIKSATIKYTEGSAFWLSERNVDLKTVYNLTTQQIMWLQKRSSSARQTIRFYCRNFITYTRLIAKYSVRLLTWNDAVIGPPGAPTWFHYRVPSITHGCDVRRRRLIVPLSNTFKSSDIVIQTHNVNRLPIRDILIGDDRILDKEFYLESEICFG